MVFLTDNAGRRSTFPIPYHLFMTSNLGATALRDDKTEDYSLDKDIFVLTRKMEKTHVREAEKGL